MAQTALVAWFGLQITGKLDLAIKERQFALESSKAVAALIAAMQGTSGSNGAAPPYKDIALRLAMYGEESIQPLIFMAAQPADYGAGIPLSGLKLVYTLHAEKVCEALRRAVNAKAAIDGGRYRAIEGTKKELGC
ncbi:hypothetical protein PEC18_29630 [Paucibacter sp. O1-1]|nr:hypothetical protein [Paucibacter sp. O1-1]MDA3829902.1 hypothetical protein [Paucibacter sp. O1-1]